MWNASVLLRLQAENLFSLHVLSRKNRFYKLCRTLQKRYWLLRKGTHDRKRTGDQQMCFSFLSLFSCHVRPLLTGNTKLAINNIIFFQLIERTAVDHPHHTLFILFALANAEKDSKYLTGGKKNATASRLTRNNSKEASSGFTEVFWSTCITISVRLFYIWWPFH